MKNRRLFQFILFLAFAVSTLPASAASLDEAISAWLADDDQAALPALSNLAKRGDTDAQLLLGIIAARPHSPYVANLTRNDQKELLRAPGGLSGISWLKVAADTGDELANALIAVQAPPFEASAIVSLLKLGEDDAAATTLVRTTAFGGVEGLTEAHSITVPLDISYALSRVLIAQGIAPPTVSYEAHKPHSYAAALLHLYAFAAHQARTPTDSPQRDQMLRLFPGDYRGTDAKPAGELLASLIETSRPAKRLFTYCDAACPDNVQVCVGDTVALLGGYDQLWRHGPPIASLITEDRHLNSPRFHAGIARHMRSLMEQWAPSRKAHWTRNSCAAASRFRTRFR